MATGTIKATGRVAPYAFDEVVRVERLTVAGVRQATFEGHRVYDDQGYRVQIDVESGRLYRWCDAQPCPYC